MHRSWLAAVALVAFACGAVPSQATLDTHNQRSYDDAVARAEQGFGGTPFTPETVLSWPGEERGPAEASEQVEAPAATADQVRGQSEREQVYRMANGDLGLAGESCLSGSACGCDLSLSYLYLRRDDGHVAVVRLVPTITTYRKKVASCGYGCGVPAPPPPTVIADLGVTDAAAIEVIDAPYRREEVDEYCDHPVPRP